MPQPATHYWVARRSIPKTIPRSNIDYWEKWWDKYKSYFGLGTATPDLFYFPLMPFTSNTSDKFYWAGVAGLLHHARSYDFFCNLLDYAKKNKNNNIEEANRQFAFAFGYYSHVVTDCIFHPYVYRSTGDHWAKDPSSIRNDPDESRLECYHKYQEFLIDQGIHKELNLNKSTSLDRISWTCPNQDNNLLDNCIAEAFYQSIISTYHDCIPSELSDPTNSSHPIQQAYSTLLETADLLFKGETIICFGKKQSFSISDIVKLLGNLAKSKDFFNSPYPECGSLDPYSPRELFNFSCAVARKIFMESIKFYEGDSFENSKTFFETNNTHFLNSGNWNLDTGIQCQFNNTKELHEDNEKMDLAHLENLKATYRYYQNDYDMLFSNEYSQNDK